MILYPYKNLDFFINKSRAQTSLQATTNNEVANMPLWSKTQDWFQRAMDTYQRPLTRYIRNLLKNLESAHEVVQEAFLRLWKNGELEFESPIRIWLYKTSRNLAIDLLRKEGKMNPTSDEEFELMCPKALPEEKVELKQIQENLNSLIDELPEKYKEILRLKFQEELSYKEMSEVTGHSPNHVGVLLHQAILHLREAISKGAQS